VTEQWLAPQSSHRLLGGAVAGAERVEVHVGEGEGWTSQLHPGAKPNTATIHLP